MSEQSFQLGKLQHQTFISGVPWASQRLLPLYLFPVCALGGSSVVSSFPPAVCGLLQFTFYTSRSSCSKRIFCSLVFVDSVLAASAEVCSDY